MKINEAQWEEGSTPANPDTGYWKLYPKSDGFYFLEDDGTEVGPLSAGYSTVLTTKGDLMVYHTAADQRIAVGSDSQVLTADSGETAGLKWAALPCELVVAVSDESTAITGTGTALTFRMPYAMTLTEVRASLNSACTTGTFTVDINESASSVLSTLLTIDATEKTSTTAAAAAVISDAALADDAEITIDIDNVGDSTATGLKVALIGTRA